MHVHKFAMQIKQKSLFKSIFIIILILIMLAIFHIDLLLYPIAISYIIQYMII